ncbi:hypothetical protein DRP07_10965 [Archaeoglobales archaeon]|nr:MAG: hypothetical protein DRP07_10965 [Archaeoglobales archaeon]
MRLRKAGIVKHVTSRFVVVSANPEALPKVGSQIFTKRMEKIGVVYDIIGPVKSPFLLIKPGKGAKLNLSSEKLFVKGDDNGRSRKGKGSRKERGRKRNRKKGN